MTARSQVAALTVRAVNAASRVSGRGGGTVAGGRVGLALDPGLLAELTLGRRVGVVSGTNGKTTTTALLAAAVDGSALGPVATNATGSNMPPGHVAALVAASDAPAAVLEVDEGYVDQVVAETDADVVVLLNLSRDQLDRMSEVRMVAERWRRALRARAETTVVANADDPLVVFAAGAATHVVWVAGGLHWRFDATGCPQCGGHIAFDDDGSWACVTGDLSRPEPSWWLDTDTVVGPGISVELTLALPGRFNVENAVLAFAGAVAMGVDPSGIAASFATVKDVAGRFVTTTIADRAVRLMLAKNPAGWSALLELVAQTQGPVVVAINARTADGADPSWLYDVDFAVLRGRSVVATGDRWRDLSVRLAYNEVPHEPRGDLRSALLQAGTPGEHIEVIGNYTAFQDFQGLS